MKGYVHLDVDSTIMKVFGHLDLKNFTEDDIYFDV